MEISVVVPTVGRVPQLRRCLESLGACSPRASEIIVVDQSGASEVRQVAADFDETGVRLLEGDGRGVARALNDGLHAARHDVVAVTHDDCAVAPDWIAVGRRTIESDSPRLITGQVLPPAGRDPRLVPSTIVDVTPRTYSGWRLSGVLYPSNMVLDRARVLALGGFDARFGPELAAEDNDFCYRWLRAGECIRYEPSLRVVHDDWRAPAELRNVYRNYGRGQGAFYAKHLRRGDLAMLRFLASDVWASARVIASARVRGRPELALAPLARLRGLPVGLVAGWRAFPPY